MTQETLIPRDVKFNVKVDIRRRVIGAADAFGKPVVSTDLVQAGVWCAIRGDSATNLWKSAEAYRAGQVVTAKPIDVYMHYSTTLEAVDQSLVVRFGGVDLNTLYAENVNQRNLYVRLLCEFGKDAV